MTEAIRFSVSVPKPDQHLLRIRMEIPRLEKRDNLDLNLPVWSPGSYKVREYGRHVQNVRAEDGDGGDLAIAKTTKASWELDCAEAKRAVVHYDIYAHELNVREKHVDGTHAFWQPTAVFMYPAGRKGDPVKLQVNPPRADWTVYCGLDRINGEETRFRAPNFNALFDAPVEMGDHDELGFEVDGVDHRMAFWGRGNWDGERLERDLPNIVAANAQMFDGLPYDDFTFITLLSESAYGGLEHRNSTALIYPQNAFGTPPEEADDEPPIDDDDYLNFLSLVAHEHFHAWNVKRLFPEAIEEFDYQSENYVRDLWTIEGITSFYDRLTLYRAGIVDADRLLKFFADRIETLESTPGRHHHSLREAGFDAWIKLYMRDEHTRNSTVSYYLKGSLVALMLDLRIRRHTDGAKSLDDLMAHLWEEFGRYAEEGYPDDYYRRAASELADADMDDFFDRYVEGTDEIDWNAELEDFGLTLEREVDEDAAGAWLGVRTTTKAGEITVKDVRAEAPAWRAGLSPGDELVAIDGWKLGEENDLSDRLEHLQAGQSTTLHVFRRGELVALEVTPDQPPADEYAIRRHEELTDRQEQLLEGWLGTTDVEVLDA